MSLHFELFPVLGANDNPRANGKVFQLLKAVRETGSLLQAAQTLDVSYRHAWGTLRAWEEMVGHQVLEAERGRGASLTRFGERLLRAEMRLRETITPAVQAAMVQFMSDVEEAGRPRTAVRFSGSHDPAVEQLCLALQETAPSYQFESVFCGSVEALICLHERQADLAGFYVSPVQGIGSVAHITLKKWLRPATVRLVRLAWREEGLIVAPHMASEINGLRDLVRTGARFVNRQRSSNARMLFDQLLAKHGIYSDQIVGYDETEFANEKVAEAVHAGRAQVGFGLRVSAEALGLSFVPLTQEAYYLALRKGDQSAPWMQVLISTLGTLDFARRLRALAGYLPAKPDGIMTPEEALPWYGADGKDRP
ncbi:substrate-binding domain-containing protein [Cupriavidus neocaledonicus]|uniref:Transcription regulator protein n=1 Tax=Cupriavidus neocaledonicus TaxID=1040979 RepID=A0A375H4A4_9BURK|nr:substrate-binding domain-containing protein [Cupriavidus neocaledonicus]SOZ38393.1 Transcription regulator protein [Cupriavidus neocaledonicus]SPD46761.1 Transcription regulator protein [Cupriavidus neocaledonicus]